MRENKYSKKAQVMGVPFQLIFSIILIIAFIYVAIIAIRSVLQTGEALKAANFVTDFRSDLEKAMGTTESIVTEKYTLPASITQVCFTNDTSQMKNTAFPQLLNNPIYSSLTKRNYVFFYPPANAEKIKIKAYATVDCETGCLNLGSLITPNLKNPYCINNTNGIVKITISKLIGKPYVTIK